MAQEGPERGLHIIAKVHVKRTKQKVSTFVCNKSHIYTNFLLRGTMVSVNYILEAQAKFMKTFKHKRPKMATGDWFFH